jgi:hypothetical protein
MAIDGAGKTDENHERNIIFNRKPFKTTWIFDLDIDNLKRNNLLKQEGKLSKYLTAMNFSLDDIPNEISRVHMYGNGLTKNTSIVIFGKIEQSDIENYMINKITKNGSTVIEHTVMDKGKKEIVKLTIKGQKGKSKHLYIATNNSDLHIASYNIYEVWAWTYYSYRLNEYNKITDHNNLINLSIDLNPTLNNMKKENSTDSYIMQSKLFQQMDGINAVVKEKNQNIYFGAVLTAKNKKDAQQLFSTINSLMDTDYAEMQSVIDKIIANTEIKKQHNTVRIGTYLAKSEL